LIGKMLAHYQVLDRIGEGGMGEVFRARDVTLDREVAIKILPAAFAADHPPEVGYLRNVYDPTPDGKAILAFVETQGPSPTIRIRTGWRKW
jgi:serine/threonine protein kinase